MSCIACGAPATRNCCPHRSRSPGACTSSRRQIWMAISSVSSMTSPLLRAPRMSKRLGKRLGRNVIVHIGTSADGYIARPDGDLEWLTSRPAPEGFYGMNAFMKSIDTKVLGRKTYEMSLRMGAKFDSQRYIVFSRRPPLADAPL